MTPYFDDGQVQLWLGDCREILPALGLEADCVIADPPYDETSLKWDKWPDGWVEVAAAVSRSMWCFGSMRMFLEHGDEFTDAGWKFSQDIIWEKANGTGFATDRFKRVHESVTHWYRGAWDGVRHETPRTKYYGPDKHARARDSRTPHTGEIGASFYEDDGTRLARSVQRVPSVRGGTHRTQKPGPIIALLLEYACPPDGLLVDCFSGSGAVLEVARRTGRRAVGFERDPAQADKAVRWLSQGVLL